MKTERNKTKEDELKSVLLMQLYTSHWYKWDSA